MSDRGYFNLLSHLTRSATSLPLATIQASIAHYLAHVQPSPAPLAGSIASSSYFRSASYAKLDALQTAFRHAVHFKVKLLKEDGGGLFTLGLTARTGAWVSEIIKGLEGGGALLRLACVGGLLLGLDDWEHDLAARDSRLRRKVEEELMVALAEVMDLYSHPSSAWEREFTSDAQDMLSAALLIAARSLPLVDPHRLTALPLGALAKLLLSTIDSAFDSGTFLFPLSESLQRTADGKLTFQPKSPFEAKIRVLKMSPLVSSMAPLSAMYVQVLAALADSRPRDAWPVMSDTLQRLDGLTGAVEAGWLQSALAAVATSDENAIAEEAREHVTTMWIILKTLLFTTIRLVQATLSVVVFVPQSHSPSSITASISTTPASPFALALTSLHILSHLSFVLPQFGGVASTGGGEEAFPELKKTFYTALDVLSADTAESARFVRELREVFVPLSEESPSNTLGKQSTSSAPGWPGRFLAAKKAYALACVEQLVPVLDDESVRRDVYPLCAPHLDDTTDRETFESAHSVVLAIFAAAAEKASDRRIDIRDREQRTGTTAAKEGDDRPLTFAEEFVPAYVQCLLDNTTDGKLNIVQLRLAFRTLVRCAGAFGSTSIPTSATVPLNSDADAGHTSNAYKARGPLLSRGDALAWYCISTLLQRILPATNRDELESEGTLHRLRLALVASVSAVSLMLLPHLLEAVRGAIEAAGPGADDSEGAAGRKEKWKRELVEALFEEIAQRMGDEEKEYGVHWWYENRVRLLNEDVSKISQGEKEIVENVDGEGVRLLGKGKAKELVARL